MAYIRKIWQNLAAGGTPINATELNRIEDGIQQAIDGAATGAAGLPVAVLSLWTGSNYPSRGAYVTDYRGPVEPTTANNNGRTITGYDQWFRSTNVSNSGPTQTSTVLAAQGPITLGTYTFTMPAVTSGDTVIFAFNLATSVAGDSTHNITVAINDQTSNGTRQIIPAAAAQTATGFSSHVYPFTATASTSGATITVTRAGTNTGTGNVRCIPHVMTITGLASPTPTIASKGAVASGATHTSPTSTVTAANTIEIGFAGDRDTTTPTTTSWTVDGTGFAALSSYAYTATIPSHSSAMGWNPTPVPAGTVIGGRNWMAVADGGVANTDSFGGSWTLGFTANTVAVTAARFAWNPATSTWVQI